MIEFKTEVMNGSYLKAVFLGLLFVFISPLSADPMIVGGNDIIARFTRDGAYDITFVDMMNTIQSDSILTGWNIWATSYAHNWSYSTAPRSLKLIIFRTNESVLEIVGKSELETVQEWDRAYHFDLTTPIQVEADDLIGWYFAGNTIPGGVISFGAGSGHTRWAYGGEISGTTPLSDFHYGAARTYSINVEGTPAIVPVPGAVLLGMLGLSVAGVKLRKHA